MSRLDELVEACRRDSLETDNTPQPLRIQVWGKDRILGIIVENQETKTTSGIIVANTKMHQDVPHACQVVKVSETVSDEYPALRRLKEECDPDSEGRIFDGPYVLYQPGGADEWDYSTSTGTFRMALLPARAIRGAYVPRSLRDAKVG